MSQSDSIDRRKRIAATRTASGLRRRTPEGPYEATDASDSRGLSHPELHQFLDFIEGMEEETERTLLVKTGSREVRLLIHLVRDHLHGRTTTATSLVNVSGLSYGTALRTIKDCEERGLILRRPRTRTGKSSSLHPTQTLLGRWQELARRTRSILTSSFGEEFSTHKAPSYYFGSSYAAASILPIQAALHHKLQLSGNLRLLAHADPTFMAMNALKQQFQTIFGVGVRGRALSIDRLRAEILDNHDRETSRYDIIASDLPWFGELAALGALLPLNGLMEYVDFDSADFHPAAMASTRYRGEQYGIPVQTTPELLVYRTDRFLSAGLDAPKSVGATLAAARHFHDPFRDRYGIAWNAGRGTPLGHTFLMVMGSFGQPIINLSRMDGGNFDGENVGDENMRPMFDSDEARATAEYLAELVDYSPPSILSMSWYERAVAYADGSVAMAYCYTLLAPLFELDPESPAHDNTGYLPHPIGTNGHSIAPVGGYALAIPSNISPERIDAVWRAICSLTSPGAVKLYLENGSLVSPRFSVSDDPQIRSISPIIPAVDAMARQGFLQMWPRPPVPEITELVAIAGDELHDVLRKVKPVHEALANAQNRADALMRSRGYY